VICVQPEQCFLVVDGMVTMQADLLNPFDVDDVYEWFG
jgi:hypothetical protein